MATKSFTTIALFLVVNLLFFSLTTAQTTTCSRNALDITTCAGVLHLVNLSLGSRALLQPCCSLISGLAELEAKACLCQSLSLTVLNLVKVNVDVGLALKVCGLNVGVYNCP